MTTNYHLLRDNLHAPHIVSIIQRVALPCGDEYGTGCTVDGSRSSPDRIVITLDYGHETYDTGHTEQRRHDAIVTPTDGLATCDVEITGADLYDHNDTIAEVIWYGLCESSSLAEELARKESASHPDPLSR